MAYTPTDMLTPAETKESDTSKPEVIEKFYFAVYYVNIKPQRQKISRDPTSHVAFAVCVVFLNV